MSPYSPLIMVLHRKIILWVILFITAILAAVSILGGISKIKDRYKKHKVVLFDTNLKNYDNVVVKRLEVDSLLVHFPKVIPSYATDIHLFCGENISLKMIQLRYKVPADVLKKIYSEQLSKALFVQQGAPIRTDETTYVFTEFRNSNNTEFEPLSSDFKLLILKVDSDEPLEKMRLNWQQKLSAGIALNFITNEVIYWATTKY